MRAAASAVLALLLLTRAGAQAPAAPYRFEPLPKTPAELAKRFTATKYDFRQLVRDICNSNTYQRATERNENALRCRDERKRGLSEHSWRR